ncbi:MAG: hypothetical protein AAF657_30255, partial [Acidobacteriota bacterium]
YSSGVAHKVFLEHLREVRRSQPKPADAGRAPWVPGRHETTDLRLDCLERGLSQLKTTERDLILRYYGPDRIRGRRELAQDLGIAAGNLRIKVYRIRTKLERWIEGEMRQPAGGGE